MDSSPSGVTGTPGASPAQVVIAFFILAIVAAVVAVALERVGV